MLASHNLVCLSKETASRTTLFVRPKESTNFRLITFLSIKGAFRWKSYAANSAGCSCWTADTAVPSSLDGSS